MYLNIESLTANKTQLKWVINQWKPAIICLVETRITDDLEKHEIEINGYKAVHTLSHSRHTGGASIYVKENLRFKTIISEILDKNMWIIGINICINKQKYTILNLYHSPNSSDGDFLDKIEQIMIEYTEKPGTLIITGDFNINLARETTYSKRLNNLIQKNALYQIVKQFTRVTQNSSTIIDLIITNDKNLEHQIHHTPKITDHSILTINFSFIENKQETQRVRDMNKFNEMQFQLDLIEYTWPENLKTTNEKANHLVQIVTEKLNIYAPIIEKRVVTKWGSKEWWTPQIGEEISKRDRLFKRATITKLEDDWNLYRQQRNSVVSLIRDQKQNFYHQKIDEVKGDSKEMWDTLKYIFSPKRQTKNVNGVIFNGKIERDDKKIAENFNKYFLESIDTIVNGTGQKYTEDVSKNITTPENKFDKFKTIHLAELRRIVNGLKNKKSSVDGINTKILKLSFEVIGNRYLEVINSCIESGSFPQNWKMTTVIPIEKISNTNKCEEFRPVNMVATYEKLLETVVSTQMRNFVEENKILTPFQAGFRKKNSCESALQTVISRWKIALNEKKNVGVVFLDFRRAFETLDRHILLKKLNKYGFKGTVYGWFSEYLTSRTQQTKYNSQLSSVKVNNHGVPQGTVLGPDLFILYINDIVKSVNKCELQLFADDTILFFESENIGTLIQTINEELENLYKWLCNNSLSLNIKKTKCMIIKPKNNAIDTYNHNGIIINSDKIEQVKEFKYLGVILDENLTFASHANYICKKISKKINFLCRIGNDLSSWTRLLIYKTIVLPHFNYCSSILYMFSQGDLDTLQKKQNQALRYILKCSRYTRITEMLNATNLLSVRQSIFLNTMTVIYKIKNGLYPEHILNKLQFVRDIHNYNTRTRLDFYVPTVNTTFAQNSLFHKGLVEFNNLPREIKINTFSTFKKLIRKYVISNVRI